MGRGAGDDCTELRRLRSELKARDQQLARLHHESVEAQQIERAQRALIHELRNEVMEATQLADSVADRLSVAELELVNLRGIRDELLEPAFVQRDGMSIAAEVIPAARHVGGDFYFVGDGPNGSTVMAIGDAVGHGLRAVRRSAFTRTAFASVAAFSDDPSQLLQWVNVALVERIGESAEFVTAACATFDPDSRMLRLACAGHHPALRLGSGTELAAARTGAVLGLAREIHCSASSYQLKPGDGMMLYTDGLTEARGHDSRYGIARVSTILRDQPALSPLETLQVLKRALRDFADEGLTDDVGLLILRAE